MSARRPRADTEAGEVNLVPVMNMVCLLIPFLLYTAAFVAFSTIPVLSPRSVPAPRERPGEPVALAVVITSQGFRLEAGEEALPDACISASVDPADRNEAVIPLAGDAERCSDEAGYPSPSDRVERAALRLGPPACAYDFGRLNECMASIKTDHPDQAEIVVGGEQGIDYEVLIRAIDAVRGSDEAPLFPSVSVSGSLA